MGDNVVDFTKMHGLGNNYCLFNQLNDPCNVLEVEDYSELSRKVSDVNFGIGSDGIILICPSRIADFKMRIFNEDGSEAKNCGNGLRCVAKYLFDLHVCGETSALQLKLWVGLSVWKLEAGLDENQSVQYVNVDMGEPKLLKGMIPMGGDPNTTTINELYTFGDEEYVLTCVSMGNPHAIIFVNDVHTFLLEKMADTLRI